MNSEQVAFAAWRGRLRHGRDSRIALYAVLGVMLVGAWWMERSAWREARSLETEWRTINAAVAKQVEAREERAYRLARILAEFGRADTDHLRAALALHGRVGAAFGLDEEELSALAVAAGRLVPADVAVVRQVTIHADRMDRVIHLESPGDFYRIMAQIESGGVYRDLLEEACVLATCGARMEVRCRYLMPGARGQISEEAETKILAWARYGP